MTDLRAAIFNEGGNTQHETYKIDNSTVIYDATVVNGSTQVGLSVTLLTDSTVKLAKDEENSLGELVSVDKDGFCVVKMRRRRAGLT